MHSFAWQAEQYGVPIVLWKCVEPPAMVRENRQHYGLTLSSQIFRFWTRTAECRDNRAGLQDISRTSSVSHLSRAPPRRPMSPFESIPRGASKIEPLHHDCLLVLDIVRDTRSTVGLEPAG